MCPNAGAMGVPYPPPSGAQLTKSGGILSVEGVDTISGEYPPKIEGLGVTRCIL